MNYEELVKALRWCKYIDYCKDCPRMAANGYVEICNIKDDAADAIEALQAVLPKRGKWIVHTEVKNIYGGICIECPVCRDHFVVLNVSDEKYCRSCGAKMEVQE